VRAGEKDRVREGCIRSYSGFTQCPGLYCHLAGV